MASILTSAFMFFKMQDKACHCKALILVSLCVLVAWRHNGTKACFDSSFLILDGSHFHCRLPRSSVASPKAAIILIYKYITWIYVLLHTHTCSHSHKWTTLPCNAQIHIHALPGIYTHWDAALLFFAVMSCSMNPENTLLLTWSLKASLKKSFVSVLNPFKD